jgi:hypothetical protein
MVRLTQDKNSTNYSLKEIDNLCLQEDKEDISFDEIISSSEESTPNSEVSFIEPGDEEVQYRKVDENKTKDVLSLFFDDDEDNEEDNENESEEKGGANSSDSGSSVESEPDSPVIKSNKKNYST